MIRHNRNTRDANEPELVDVFRRLGGVWFEGPPLDGWAFVYRMGLWMPVEIKRPEREGQKHEFTPAQKEFFAKAAGARAQWWTWRTADDVMHCMGAK
jgi:hypothetical protein